MKYTTYVCGQCGERFEIPGSQGDNFFTVCEKEGKLALALVVIDDNSEENNDLEGDDRNDPDTIC